MMMEISNKRACIKNIMSECLYDYVDGQIILTLKKKIQ